MVLRVTKGLKVVSEPKDIKDIKDIVVIHRLVL